MSNLITPNGDGVTSLTDRQIKKQMAHNATIADVLDLSHQVAVQAVNHLGNQIPAQVETQCRALIAEAFAALVQVLEERYVLTPRQPSAPVDATAEERRVPIVRIPFAPSPHIEGPDEDPNG